MGGGGAVARKGRSAVAGGLVALWGPADWFVPWSCGSSVTAVPA